MFRNPAARNVLGQCEQGGKVQQKRPDAFLLLCTGFSSESGADLVSDAGRCHMPESLSTPSTPPSPLNLAVSRPCHLLHSAVVPNLWLTVLTLNPNL